MLISYFAPRRKAPAFGGYRFHGQFNCAESVALDFADRIIPAISVQVQVVLRCKLQDYFINTQDSLPSSDTRTTGQSRPSGGLGH